MADDPPRLIFEIADELLILDFEHHAFRQHVAPMLHQRLIGAIIAPQLGEVVGMFLADCEKDREAG